MQNKYDALFVHKVKGYRIKGCLDAKKYDIDNSNSDDVLSGKMWVCTRWYLYRKYRNDSYGCSEK